MKILITGTAQGLGRALRKRLRLKHIVVGVDKEGAELTTIDFICDVRSEDSIKDLYRHYSQSHNLQPPFDIIINNAGVNHLNWLEDLTIEQWDDCMNTNARGIFLMAKTFLPDLLKTRGRIINILSNAATKPMTNSLAYNASKAAAEMATKQLSRELAPQGITVFGISPNKLTGTKMSEYVDSIVPTLRGWTPQYAREYEKKNLPAGEETDLDELVSFISYLLLHPLHNKYLAGTIIPYGS